jgi:hypothetical protein
MRNNSAMNKLSSKIKILLLSFLLVNSVSGQTGKYKPFKLIIIAPDTAIIDSSLNSYIDTIQQDHLNSYYRSIKQMEEMLAFNDYPKDVMTEKEFKESQQRTKSTLDTAKKYESEVKQFKYYQTISEYSAQVYNLYFNEYPPLSTFQLIDKSELTTSNLSHIADSLKADYVVGYKNIQTENSKGEIAIKLTTVLYSKKENKILSEKETWGDTYNHGDMWTCLNPLECLLVTAVNSSTDNVAEILRKRQWK